MTISWEDPRLDITTNVLGTFNVLEAARKLKIPVASCATIHVYGNKINDELQESKTRYTRNLRELMKITQRLAAHSRRFMASKAALDIYTKRLHRYLSIGGCELSTTGIYGTRQFGGEDHGWVANFAIRSVLNWPLTVFGTGKQIRDIIICYGHL